MSISLNDALAAVYERVTSAATEVVATDGAAGRILGADVVSGVDLPPFANSAMDGFAVRSRETVPSGREATQLRITIESRAGAPSALPLEPGCAARISTGALLPDGADAVVPIEDVTVVGDIVHVTDTVQRGSNIRGEGEDIRQIGRAHV